ncbi:hypothetical protein HNY73_020545 [Argiope bruennichi]|uniref:Uncharacterized protein n=1 Tax=Argiope bruennichi TaxID=94029 RepID=A0A8T0E888_ARGBR|nr:hypothetical protein HNY73_020545 [Argiope bruennichi]
MFEIQKYEGIVMKYEVIFEATLAVIEVDDFSVSLHTPLIQERRTSHRESRGQTYPSLHSPAFSSLYRRCHGYSGETADDRLPKELIAAMKGVWVK